MNPSSPLLDHDAIADRIPHAGRMCLLDAVITWDAQRIVAHAVSHQDADNPLRNAMGLPVTAGIEYAAQAMAVHGSLLAPAGMPRSGMLASVRNVRGHARWLDRERQALEITASRISGDDAGMVYDFEIRAGNRLLLSGRASVALLPAGT